jgi:hypothetical protein
MQYSNLLTDERVWRLPKSHSCDVGRIKYARLNGALISSQLEFLENLLLNGFYTIVSL